MECENSGRRWSIASLYDILQRFYSAIPYRYFKNGYAFPAWHYYIELTRRCNLRCKMCQYIDWLENVPIKKQMEGELSTEEWKQVISQIPSWSLITFTGGEPFVRKDFMELFIYASQRARTHFISNGTMITEERAKTLVQLAPKRLGGKGFNFAGTSIEAPGNLHDEIRQMRGAFERTIAGIHFLYEERKRMNKKCPMIHITTVIQESNIEILPQMPQFVKEIGGDVLNLVTESRALDLPGLGDVDPSVYKPHHIRYPRIDREKLTYSLTETIKEASRHKVQLRLPRMPLKAIIDYYSNDINLDDFLCRNAWNTLFIGRTGDVYPCWIKKVGNIRQSTLKELWNNHVMREFRKECQHHLWATCPGCCFIEHK
ncbi:MAG TPA: radical SAM protein [Candidatus Hydrogenedens sp.]|nr:radical SAM protein [Candidatus Hydrogenedens sp.]HOL19662.1 radical SAM protein [Candidatus Hydrogenedens sp.]HPP57728.1 radical SAM protein [Candidatus Hydrogenedens sp.]